MSLIQNLTMKSLCENALELTKNKVNLANCVITMPNSYEVDITSANIQTQFEIKYTGSGPRLNPGMHAVVYLLGETPEELRGTLNKQVVAFNITSNHTDQEAYERMFAICYELARNIRLTIDRNKAVVRTNKELMVTTEINGETYKTGLQDLMRRRNRWKKCSKSGIEIRTEQIPNDKILGCLMAAYNQYRYVLTPRKLERLSILINERTGKCPTCKQRQKMIRDLKEQAQAG